MYINIKEDTIVLILHCNLVPLILSIFLGPSTGKEVHPLAFKVPNAISHIGRPPVRVRRILAAIWPLLVRNNKDIQNQTRQ